MDVDGYADAPAPALQRAIGRAPWLSAFILVALYIGIGIRTGLAAYRFPRIDVPGRAGILLAWVSIMSLLAIGFWTLFVSSRLRWYQICLRRSVGRNDTPEDEKLAHAAHRLVGISQRLRPVIKWSMGLAVTAGIIGIGLLVVFFPYQPG